MIYEGVNFNEDVCGKMTAEEFEAAHVDIFWKDRDEATRKKMLAEAYKLMTKPAKPTKSGK